MYDELASSQLFAGLTKDEVSAILAATVRRRFGASETVIEADDPATHLFVVRSGSADYFVVSETGHRILLRRMLPGNVFGVAAFISQQSNYLGVATAVHTLEVLTWEHRLLHGLARAYPRLVNNAFRIALHYIAMYAERHARLVSCTASERLASALTGLAFRMGHTLPDGVEVNVKNDDLAALADVSPFTTSRLLNEWERKGAVEKARGKVLIRCPEKLIT
jgi:CRP-like cAMP-binding protein